MTPRKDVPQPMSDQLTGPPTGGHVALRIAAVAAACIGVVALVAGAFVFSYPGLHAVALQAQVSPRLARGYPLIFDALLIVAMLAALTLRSAGWPSRVLAWVILLALLGAVAGADALHAAGRRLEQRPAAITAAIVPWAVVLLAFVLLLAMLQHARARRLASERASGPDPVIEPTEPLVYAPIPPQPLVPGFPDRTALSQSEAIAAAEIAGPIAAVAEPIADDPVTGARQAELIAGPGHDAAYDPPADLTATEDGALGYDPLVELTSAEEDFYPATQSDDDDPEMPVFHRAWSAPAAPGDAAQ
jgi:hypothetical protein